MPYEFRHTPRPGHVAEHAAGTPRNALADWPGTERPASRTAGFTWTFTGGRGGRLFVPFAALGIVGRSGVYSPEAVDQLHRNLVAMDSSVRPTLRGLPDAVEYEPAGSPPSRPALADSGAENSAGELSSET